MQAPVAGSTRTHTVGHRCRHRWSCIWSGNGNGWTVVTVQHLSVLRCQLRHKHALSIPYRSHSETAPQALVTDAEHTWALLASARVMHACSRLPGSTTQNLRCKNKHGGGKQKRVCAHSPSTSTERQHHITHVRATRHLLVADTIRASGPRAARAIPVAIRAARMHGRVGGSTLLA